MRAMEELEKEDVQYDTALGPLVSDGLLERVVSACGHVHYRVTKVGKEELSALAR